MKGSLTVWAPAKPSNVGRCRFIADVSLPDLCALVRVPERDALQATQSGQDDNEIFVGTTRLPYESAMRCKVNAGDRGKSVGFHLDRGGCGQGVSEARVQTRRIGLMGIPNISRAQIFGLLLSALRPNLPSSAPANRPFSTLHLQQL
jgi:hypothetical protein